MAKATLDAPVAAIHAGSQRSYGRPRIVRGLREQGIQVGHERVRNSRVKSSLIPQAQAHSSNALEVNSEP